MGEPLRFAPLIRVSTEGQAKKGESLRTQRKQIEQAVEILGGSIPESCWKYSGQEHATPDQERSILDQLLKDSGKGIFDAIIVCDASRWSRDNRKSKDGLNVLKENGTRFFIGTSEYNLFLPEPFFFLSLSVEIGEFQANQQAQKSILNRIERTKRGVPSTGRLPYGRTFDKQTETWGIDHEKQKIIERAAKEYLNDQKGPDIAKKYGFFYPNLMRILRERCGDKWKVKLNNNRLNIHEKITMTIPRLLPDETIRAIHEKTASNRTFNHGELKNIYPLRSILFCAKCGVTLTGQANRLNKLYYRHRRHNVCEPAPFNSIPADLVEDAVLFELFKFFGDKAKMEKAARDAIPNIEELKEMKEKIASHKKELNSIKKKRSNLITVMEEFGIEHGDVKERFAKLVEREDLLKNEIIELTSRISEFPTEEEISMKSQLVQRTMETFHRGPDYLKEMTARDKRSFFRSIFGGKDKNGDKFGIYVRRYQRKNGEKDWQFILKGRLTTPGINDKAYPLLRGEKEAIMDVPDGFFDDDWKERDHKLNSRSKKGKVHRIWGIRAS